MNSSVSRMQLSILGEQVKVVEIQDETIAVHTSVRLCPGRAVTVRTGRAATASMTVISSFICALLPTGPQYAVRLSASGPMSDNFAAALVAVTA